MKNQHGVLLYVGKAANLKRRVSSYFNRSHEARIESMVSRIHSIEYKKTGSVLEALMLEAELIKKYKPPFNVREKDDRSFLYVEITKEPFPRVLLVRGKSEIMGKRFGPFVSASDIREALRILRRIFPWNTHSPEKKISIQKKPCFDYQIGLCPGTCIGAITKSEYRKQINYLNNFFAGKKERVVVSLEKEMKEASKKKEFEHAEKLRRQINALRHIKDTALIKRDVIQDTKYQIQDTRIEGYDISNISGTSAVGSMVVFIDGKPDKSEYRKFKIRTVEGPNDVAMLREILQRRFQHPWQQPNLILVDGGLPQVHCAEKVLRDLEINIPIVGIAKGRDRKKNEFVGNVGRYNQDVLVKVRDEAHRFAITYHRAVRKKAFLR
ncbi:MAG: UvrB/UvrC motif-containing protein [Parcubacteria group bacterium]|nr:UvrB/UvrC motif-containing protein [Parcubacteria group bacterium]